jgi:hypothetical protein
MTEAPMSVTLSTSIRDCPACGGAPSPKRFGERSRASGPQTIGHGIGAEVIRLGRARRLSDPRQGEGEHAVADPKLS